jgi:hypothetical protein
VNFYASFEADFFAYITCNVPLACHCNIHVHEQLNIYNRQLQSLKNISCRNIFYLVAKLRCTSTSMYVFLRKLQRSGRIDFILIFVFNL